MPRYDFDVLDDKGEETGEQVELTLTIEQKDDMTDGNENLTLDDGRKAVLNCAT